MTIQLLNPVNLPSPSQIQFLRAALLDDEAAVRAWQDWKQNHDLDNLDHASFQVAPTLYARLKSLVDDADLRRLSGVYRYSWVLNQQRLRALQQLSAAFDRHGIIHVALKGLPLAKYYYQDIGARLMSDFDVLVPRGQAFQAGEILKQGDWTLHGLPIHPQGKFSSATQFLFGPQIELDLQWKPYPLSLSLAHEHEFWNRCQPVDDSTRMLLPDVYDLLLLTCLHGRKGDRQSASRWIADVYKIIQRAGSQIEPGSLLERLRRYDVLSPVRDALTFVYQEFELRELASFVVSAWKISPSTRDLRRYGRLLSGPRQGRFLWRQFSDDRHCSGLSTNPLFFPSYATSYIRWRFRTTSTIKAALCAIHLKASRSGQTLLPFVPHVVDGG